MTISHFPGKPHVPAAVADLDHNLVVAALARHGCNVTDAAQELHVLASDLRRLLWANAKLQDAAFEVVEARLDTAEKNIAEALKSEDNRRRDAASFFVLRNTARAKAQRLDYIERRFPRHDRQRQPAAAPSGFSLANFRR
jgi:hypothetical protein